MRRDSAANEEGQGSLSIGCRWTPTGPGAGTRYDGRAINKIILEVGTESSADVNYGGGNRERKLEGAARHRKGPGMYMPPWVRGGVSLAGASTYQYYRCTL